MAEYVVTPWEVSGKIDYRKLIKEFGTKPLTDAIIRRIEKHAGKSNLFLRRKIFFSHRDMDLILDKYEKGQSFALYTGRGPSGHTHLGHLMPWLFTKFLQDAFGADLYFQLTDDEKSFVKNLSLQQTKLFAYENALDIIACGFDPKKTFIFIDTEYAKTLYGIAAKIAKRTTFSTTKAVFGFSNETNIGLVFFPAIQAAPCFLPSVLKGKNIPVLIPAAIDQDSYWRGVARAVAPKLGFPKPAQIHNIFLPGLGEQGKMSASKPSTAIYTTDDSKTVEAKVAKAFTGGKPTIKEQKEKGGNPDICPVMDYFYYLFEEDDKKVGEQRRLCREGKLLCGQHKKMLAKKVNCFLKGHQKRREKAKNKIEKFMLRD
jgi:tryptophanyl-tRNA synthetase